MVHVRTITVPANTSASAPLKTSLKVLRGIITRSRLIFPPGPSGLVYVRACEGESQFFPATPGESFWGDNINQEFDDLYEITDDNRIINIYAYNLDAAYEHRFQIQFSIESKDIYIARWVPSMQVAMFEEELKRIKEGASVERQTLIEAVADRYGIKGL